MARINPKLLERLQQRLNLSSSQIYKLIDQKVRELSLSRDVAAIALASERGMNIGKFATAEDLAQIRQARAGSAGAVTAAPTVVAPRPPAPKRPATKTGSTGGRRQKSRPRRPSNSVFVVHGRNLPLRDEVFRFLRALGLQPIEWNQAIRMTGEPTPYVGTILDTAFREAAAIVVLFTPDDDAKLRRRYQKASDPSYEKRLTGQARANVLFEAGMAFGKNPDHTVLVEIGDGMRPFSDIGGRHVVRLTNSASSRRELATKLDLAGCAVDESGTAWLSEGDFSL